MKSKALIISLSIIFPLLGAAGITFSLIYKLDGLLYISFLLGFLFTFIVMLERVQDRINKGTSVILLGVFWGIGVPLIIEDFLYESVREYIEIAKNFIIFSCSGAGGGILAAHAEQSNKVAEQKKLQQVVVDKTEKIESLISSFDQLKSLVLGLYAVSLLSLVLAAIALLK